MEEIYYKGPEITFSSDRNVMYLDFINEYMAMCTHSFRSLYWRRTNMAAQVDTLRLLAQPELTENPTARKSDTKEIKNKHSSRPVGGAEMGSWGGEDSCGCGRTETGRVWDQQGRQSDHQQTLQPHIRAHKPRGPESVAENGAGRAAGSAPRPHIRAQINWTKGGEQSRPRNPGLQRGK